MRDTIKMKDMKKNGKKVLELILFIATGGGCILYTLKHDQGGFPLVLTLGIGGLYLVGLRTYTREYLEQEEKSRPIIWSQSFYAWSCSVLAVALTWILNHSLGTGPFISSGIVGVLAAALLPPALAGAVYTASFVGMSSLAVLPTLNTALLAGGIVGLVIHLTPEVYKGIGGKGGTTAALSTLITQGILKIFF